MFDFVISTYAYSHASYTTEDKIDNAAVLIFSFKRHYLLPKFLFLCSEQSIYLYIMVKDSSKRHFSKVVGIIVCILTKNYPHPKCRCNLKLNSVAPSFDVPI